ncbi:ornithine decarboxylase [Litorivivens lipolytica]|uniref:ornithine decarboxylase n=1 Tax=Litorivivens lipolytica TaxID=1524264 RepID=A0A7W4Z583_9GAMM|nr:type III PLP-dependent enzyme [Litorivivens lipolytica]MBB3046953.1 ornithine decarboxylase [Litorivivens lipolytica]
MEQAILPESSWQRIREFAADKQTPCLVVDREVIRGKYQELREVFPFASVYYAVKANPDQAVIGCLEEMGSNFDIASVYELDKLLSLGVSADRMSYGNTIKKAREIEYAYNKGIRMFATDSESDLRNVAKYAPGSKLYVRILTEGTETADWPLSRKFGCQADMAIELIVLAKELGLEAVGISFHVGSQQRDIGAWDAAIAKVRFIFDRVAEHGIKLRLINMGGGLPALYSSRSHEIDAYGAAIRRFLDEDFGEEQPEIIIEPGRSLVGESGVLVSEVVLISRKSRDSLYRWVYLDVGLFGGLIESLGEAIKYPLYCDKAGDGVEEEEVVLAGPTCDSMDILYEDHRYSLPQTLEAGDRLYWLSTGAYTTSYSSVEFNGFPPLKTYVI